MGSDIHLVIEYEEYGFVDALWEHRDYDSKRVDIVGDVVESALPRRLVVTWVPPADEGNREKTSRVTYDIEPVKDGVVRSHGHTRRARARFRNVPQRIVRMAGGCVRSQDLA